MNLLEAWPNDAAVGCVASAAGRVIAGVHEGHPRRSKFDRPSPCRHYCQATQALKQQGNLRMQIMMGAALL
eukprot:5777347-Amphidinium_carterae.1